MPRSGRKKNAPGQRKPEPTTRLSTRSYGRILLVVIPIMFLQGLNSQLSSNTFKAQFLSAISGQQQRQTQEPCALGDDEDDGDRWKANATHWCVLSVAAIPMKAEWFDHFPHCMEVVLPCWSWFRSQNATNDCGFVLLDDLKFDRKHNHTWQNQLIVSHMGCQVRHSDPRLDANYTPANPILDATPTADGVILQRPNLDDIALNGEVYHVPNVKFMRPRYGNRKYLQSSEDAQELRRAVGVSDEWVATKKGLDKALQIGLVKRTESRMVTNLEDIAAGLQEALPDANVTVSTLEDAPTVLDQAKWFASKDVIVATHGAALTNAVFITKGTHVVQIYPPGFHWQSMDPLIEQSGGNALDWYEGEEPIKAAIETMKDYRKKNRAQFGNFEVPVAELVEIVEVALNRKVPSDYMMKKSNY